MVNSYTHNSTLKSQLNTPGKEPPHVARRELQWPLTV
jgi:hypothetical protein